MPNLNPWVNQNEYMTTNTINKFENHLLSIKTERQKIFILTHILPIMNVNKKYRNDRFDYG